VPGDRAAGRFDLTGGDPLRLHGLEAEGAEVELGPALGIAMDRPLKALRNLVRLGCSIVVSLKP
jgi:hypothetical protein